MKLFNYDYRRLYETSKDMYKEGITMAKRKFDLRYKDGARAGEFKLYDGYGSEVTFLSKDDLMVVYYRGACYVYDYAKGVFETDRGDIETFYVEVPSLVPEKFLDYFTNALKQYKSGFDEEDIEDVAAELYEIATEGMVRRPRPKGGIYGIKDLDRSRQC